jgi:hypothetical protein
MVRTAMSMAPPTRFTIKMVIHSCANRAHGPAPPSFTAAATGSKKFSLNSSVRPTMRNTKPIPNASAPASLAASGPRPGSTSDSTTPSATVPNTMVTPAMKPVIAWSWRVMDSRRCPSASARR